jgi:hypothetical protein
MARRFALLMSNPCFSLGRYVVSPLTRLLDDGAYSASVSIRSGRGQASSDRVLRLIGRFTTADGALRHAAAQGRAWVHAACGA